MPDFVDVTIVEIDRRLGELGQEQIKLEAARAALLGRNGEVRAAASPRLANTNRGPGRPRGRRSRTGTRADQTVTLIRENPGITIPQLAEKLKIQPSYLYRVVPKLVSDRLITKDGSALSPVSSAA